MKNRAIIIQGWAANIIRDTHKSNLLLPTICLFLLAVYNLIIGNSSYTLFLILFFLTYRLLRPSAYIFLVITLLVIVFWGTSSPEALAKIRTTNLAALNNPKPALNNLFTPNSGKTNEVLDNDILWMLSMINKYDLKDYMLTDALSRNVETRKYIVESAWPIKMENESKNLFIRVEDAIAFSNCDLENQNKELAIVRCP